MSGKYRKRPLEVHAQQWTGNNFKTVSRFIGASARIEEYKGKLKLWAGTGINTVEAGDYIIRGIEGEIYPCSKSVFEATYERG